MYIALNEQQKYQSLISSFRLKESFQDGVDNYIAGGYGAIIDNFNDKELSLIAKNTKRFNSLYRVDLENKFRGLKEGEEFSFKNDIKSFSKSNRAQYRIFQETIDTWCDEELILFKVIGELKAYEPRPTINTFDYQEEVWMGGRFKVLEKYGENDISKGIKELGLSPLIIQNDLVEFVGHIYLIAPINDWTKKYM